MSTQANSPEPPSNYFTDAESAAEMARLVRQARMLRHSFGLLPSSLEQAERWQVLDIGCGPGEWAIEMAQQYPSCQVFGIDISVPMITYASSFAESRKLSNVQFRVMSAGC
jgi:tRNA G46 methylase TrmB